MHIDWWTLALQAVNFLILLWLLQRFLYRPVSAMVRKRQDEARKLLDEAEQARHAAESERGEIEKTRQGFAAERDTILAAGRAKAEEERKALLAKAQAEAAKVRKEAEAELARAAAVRDHADAASAEELAVTIARRLLGRLPDAAAAKLFIDGLCERIRGLPEQSRRVLASAGQIEIVTAAPLAEEEKNQIRSALAAILPSAPALVFTTDPAVIAGIELQTRDLILRNSWREDLDRIRREIGRDGG
jgi:F-type H+-transporting ATPase subunit b